MGVARWLASIAAIGILGACGGGGGGGGGSTAPPPPPPPPPPPAAQFSLTASTLTFTAAEPKSSTPAAQEITGNVTGTITGTTLFVLITAAGDVVSSISTPVISGTSGSALVTPVAPMALGAGTFSETLTVRACVDSSTCASGELAGSPRIVNVTYTIGSPVQQDTVMPHVVGRDAAGTVIIRGADLGSVTSVSFGANAGGTPTVRNSTEISVLHPPMPPGSYAVSLNNGTVPFTGSLVVAESPAFAEDVLAYPAAPDEVAALVYDAERRALFVALRYTDPNANEILRYTFDGMDWSAPTTLPFARVRDIAISQRGDRLIALRDAEIVEHDPISLAMINQAVNFDFVGQIRFMRHLALANDGHALITTDIAGSGVNNPYLYSLSARTFTKLGYVNGSQLKGNTKSIGPMDRALPGTSGDGSRVVMVQGQRSPPVVFQYADGRLTETSLVFAHANLLYRPALDRSASRILLSDTTTAPVLDGDYAVFCTLPSITRAYAVSPAGNRAFTVNDANVLQAFLLDTNGGPCLQDGPDTPLAFDTGIDPSGVGFAYSNVRMTISPDAATLFMAGVNGVLVKPWP
jgi:hypothetical protein